MRKNVRRHLVCWRLAMVFAAGAVIGDVDPALGRERKGDYRVDHAFRLKPGGNVVPEVQAVYYAHAYVVDKFRNAPTREKDEKIPDNQTSGWKPFGRDKLVGHGLVKTKGRAGSYQNAREERLNIPAAGFGPQEFKVDVAEVSTATALCKIQVDAFGRGSDVIARIGSHGDVLAKLSDINTNHRSAKAYAFSMTTIAVRGGIGLRSGRILWRPTIAGTVAGRTVRRLQRDPIDFVVEDLVTGEVLEGTLLSIDVDLETGGGEGFTWQDDLVSIASGTELNFVLDQSSPFNNPQGFLELSVSGGEITESTDSGVYDNVLPPVGTLLPITFSLPNDIEFDYDLGEFNGHEVDVALDFGGHGETEAELIEPLSVPAVSDWGVLATALILLTGTALKFGRRHASARAA